MCSELVYDISEIAVCDSVFGCESEEDLANVDVVSQCVSYDVTVNV